MIITSIPFSVSADSENIIHVVDGINTYREANTLILYRGIGTTDSNPWGYEVMVDKNNRVISVGGNNNTIPKDGFVLSGHGVNATFLKENIQIGDQVFFIEESMIISIGENEPSPFYSTTMNFNGVNIYRAADYAVIYIPSAGETTGTNTYGFEVTVENGIVTKCGGSNSVIPKNGFVISAHGKASTALQGMAQIGMKVSYDESAKTITFEYGEKSLLIADEAEIIKAENALSEATEKCSIIDVAAMTEKVNTARSSFENYKVKVENGEAVSEYLNKRKEILSIVEEVLDGTSESRPVEYRAVWIESKEQSKRQVEKTVQSLYDRGINTICLETLVQGTVIYKPADDSLIKQLPTLRGFDLLQAYADVCHELGMELHVWMPVFGVGSSSSQYASLSLFTQKPDWRIVSDTGSDGADSGVQFLNPANKEACDYLLKTYRYILESYDIDGFQLDYIRYPHTGDDDWGYDDQTIAAFKEKYGITPKYDFRASYWSDWVSFREDYVTDFVRRMRALVDEVAPNVALSADLYGSIDTAHTAVYQNGQGWIEEGLLDIAFPMTYDDSSDGFEQEASAYISLNTGIFTVCGIGSYMTRQNASMSRDQVKVLKSLDGDGYSFFENTSYISREIGEKLEEGAFSERAIPPLRNVFQASVSYSEFMQRRINEIVVPASLLTDAEAAELLDVLSAISGRDVTKANIERLTNAISNISNERAKAALQRDLDYLNKILAHFDWVIPTEDESSDEPSKTDESLTSESEGSNTIAPKTKSDMLTIVIAAIGVIAAAAVVAVIVVRKKKKDKQ